MWKRHFWLNREKSVEDCGLVMILGGGGGADVLEWVVVVCSNSCW